MNIVVIYLYQDFGSKSKFDSNCESDWYKTKPTNTIDGQTDTSIEMPGRILKSGSDFFYHLAVDRRIARLKLRAPKALSLFVVCSFNKKFSVATLIRTRIKSGKFTRYRVKICTKLPTSGQIISIGQFMCRTQGHRAQR